MRRILVVATRQIGDVLLTTPLIRAARERIFNHRLDARRPHRDGDDFAAALLF